MADLNYLVMVLFLLVGFAANLPFLIRSVADAAKSASPLRRAMPSAPPALVTTAFSELCWVLPCLVQCAISLFNGDAGAWAPIRLGSGCDVMATYSIFASMSGMLSTVAVSAFTYYTTKHGPSAVSAKTSAIVGVAVLVGSALFAAVPRVVGGSWYTGSGFCYLNFYDPTLAILNLLITGPAVVSAVVFLTLTLKHGGWPSQLDLVLMLVAFVSAWSWWIPASFVGLAGGTFPMWYFPPIGFLAHGQALINPYLYGIRWRRSALLLASADGKVKPADSVKTAEMAVTVGVTPATAEVKDVEAA